MNLGLGWAGCWAGQAGLGCWAAGLLGCWAAGLLGCWAAGLLGCWAAGLLGCWATGLLGGAVAGPGRAAARGAGLGLGGWGTLKRFFENETEISLFENGKVCLHRKNEVPDGQQQQAISIYVFLEGLGFRV